MKNSIIQKVCMISLGCAKNLVDSEILIGGLKQESYEMVQKSDDANILIVNTCGFLDTAREESVSVILEAGELRRSKKVEKLVVMGCFSDRYGSDLKDGIPEVDAFFGTNDHAAVLSYLTGKSFTKEDPDYFRSLLNRSPCRHPNTPASAAAGRRGPPGRPCPRGAQRPYGRGRRGAFSV